MERELIDQLNQIAARLRRNDPYLTHFEPIVTKSSSSSASSNAVSLAYTALLLEHAAVQQALSACFQACVGNSRVKKVTITALPEVELAQALHYTQQLQDLQELTVQQTTKSQSLNFIVLLQVLQAHMPIPSLGRPGLRKILMDTRIVVHTNAEMEAIAAALRLYSNLQDLQLHILPRCSIQNPDLSVQSILQTVAELPSLKSVAIVLGYDHNPYYKPMIQDTGILHQLLSSQTLERVQLDNFGLRDIHLQAITAALRSNQTLRKLQFARNNGNAFSLSALEDLCDAIAEDNYKLESCVFWTTDECRRRRGNNNDGESSLSWQQEHLHMWCLLNRLGRTNTRHQQQRQHSDVWAMIGKAASLAIRPQQQAPSALENLVLANLNEQSSTATDRYSLGAIFTLLRTHPLLIRPNREAQMPSTTKGFLPVQRRRRRKGTSTTSTAALPPPASADKINAAEEARKSVARATCAYSLRPAPKQSERQRQASLVSKKQRGAYKTQDLQH